MPSRRLLGGDDAQVERVDTGSVVLVTAPIARSGKSTTSANLAACLAESGRRVLVIDADFRNPAMGEMFGVEEELGLTDLVLMGEAAQLEKIMHRSPVAPVRVMTAGRQATVAGVVEANVGQILSRAKMVADVVIVDAAPLLNGSDALEIMPHVDTVLMVGRVRRTTRDQAVRSRELLARIGVPVPGVALVGTRSRSTAPSGNQNLRDRLVSLRPSPARLRAAAKHGTRRS
jgi:polysaccharide biosynthesis transport protein